MCGPTCSGPSTHCSRASIPVFPAITVCDATCSDAIHSHSLPTTEKLNARLEEQVREAIRSLSSTRLILFVDKYLLPEIYKSLAQGTMPYGRRLLFKTLLRILPGISSMSRRHNLCQRLKQAEKALKSRVPCRTDESDMVYAEELLKELIHVSNPFPPRPTTSATKTAAAAAKNEVSVACPALACPAGCAGCVGAS